jgi:hypothetical protein
MTRAELAHWLETRRPTPPPALAEHLRAPVADARLALPLHLADLGRVLLARVAAAPQEGRALALDLLAADAFVTYAFEAQAELDPAGLAPLADRIAGADR